MKFLPAKKKARFVAAIAAAAPTAVVIARNTHPLPEVRATIVVTNRGVPLRFVNLGESRWSGADYELFHPGDHIRVVAAGASGDPVEILPGTYDVRVTFSNGERFGEKWFERVALERDSERDVELGVTPAAIGPQMVSNTWQP